MVWSYPAISLKAFKRLRHRKEGLQSIKIVNVSAISMQESCVQLSSANFQQLEVELYT